MKLVTTVAIALGAFALSACCEKRNDCAPTIEVGELITLYEIDYLNDHCIIYNEEDKKWHLFGIISPSTSFIHLTSDKLTKTGWTRENDFRDNGKEIWAPHIVKHDGLYYMFYTKIGEPRQICLATSKDLNTWEYEEKPMMAFHSADNPNLKNKDPMVFRDEASNQWIMYYSMMKDAENWVVGYSTSKDLRNWSDYKICFDENADSPGVESPFVVKQGDNYFMFLSARPWPSGGQDVFVSKTPFHWESGDQVKRFFPWHAAEIIQDLDGQWFMTFASGLPHDDIRIAPIDFK